MLQILNWKHKKKGATPNSINLEKRYTRELFDLRHPETRREISIGESEKIYNKSDVCTKAMFNSFKSISKQNWINELYIADEWKEGREPNFKTDEGEMNRTRKNERSRTGICTVV